MADKTKIESVLFSAHRQNLLNPSSKENICFRDHLNTGNQLLYALKMAGDNGLSTSQVIARMNLHHNTCKLYLKALSDLGYVLKDHIGGNQEAIWYFK